MRGKEARAKNPAFAISRPKHWMPPIRGTSTSTAAEEREMSPEHGGDTEAGFNARAMPTAAAARLSLDQPRVQSGPSSCSSLKLVWQSSLEGAEIAVGIRTSVSSEPYLTVA